MGANWSQLLHGVAKKFADTGQHCMSRCAWWFILDQDDMAVQSRLESGRGTLFATSQSIWQTRCTHFFFTSQLYVTTEKDSQYLVHLRACWYKRNHPALMAYLKHLIEGFFLLCPRTVGWLKSHSVRFTVALEYGFIMNWFCLRSCLRCIIYFLEYQIQHLKEVSVRKDDASRGQCITILNLFYLIWKKIVQLTDHGDFLRGEVILKIFVSNVFEEESS